MAKANIGCLVVTDAHGRLAGIFSERDMSARVLSAGLDPERTTVGEVMSPNVVSIRPDWPIEAAEELMNRHKVRHLPVTVGGPRWEWSPAATSSTTRSAPARPSSTPPSRWRCSRPR